MKEGVKNFFKKKSRKKFSFLFLSKSYKKYIFWKQAIFKGKKNFTFSQASPTPSLSGEASKFAADLR